MMVYRLTDMVLHYHAYTTLPLPVILAYIFTHVISHFNRETHVVYIKMRTLW